MSDGIYGPIWVQDVQVEVAALGVFLGIALRILKFKLHIVRPERLLLYCFLLAVGATIITMWEMQIALGLHTIRGVLITSANVTVSMLGTGEAIDLGAKGAGLNIRKYDATRRRDHKWSL